MFTPLTLRVNPKDPSKPLLTLQSPASRAIVKLARRYNRAHTIAKDAFLEDEDRIEAAIKLILFVASTGQLDHPRRILRFKEDPVYEEIMTKLVRDYPPAFRPRLVLTGRHTRSKSQTPRFVARR